MYLKLTLLVVLSGIFFIYIFPDADEDGDEGGEFTKNVTYPLVMWHGMGKRFKQTDRCLYRCSEVKMLSVCLF